MVGAMLSQKSCVSSMLGVDDEGEQGQVRALPLTKAGFSVRPAAYAEEATEMLAGGDIGIVVVDGDMPDVSGFVLNNNYDTVLLDANVGDLNCCSAALQKKGAPNA